MNMNHSPNVGELTQLLTTANDTTGHHSLWIERSGEVHLSVIPAHLSPIGFEQATPSMEVRFETFDPGKGYVGPAAAADAKYVAATFARMVKAWTPALPAGVKYVDY